MKVVDDLRDSIQINDKSEIILYKVMRLDSVSLSLLSNGAQEAIPIIQDTPISSHVSQNPLPTLLILIISGQVKQKKHSLTGELLYFQVDLNVDQLLLNLSVEQYQLCRGLLEGILSCFARQPTKDTKTDTPSSNDVQEEPFTPSASLRNYPRFLEGIQMGSTTVIGRDRSV